MVTKGKQEKKKDIHRLMRHIGCDIVKLKKIYEKGGLIVGSLAVSADRNESRQQPPGQKM